jgi:thermolabile hemolysin
MKLKSITRPPPLIFSAIFLALGLVSGHGAPYSAFYVFGDSLSDTGRNPATPATSYYNGRYSNGPLWVEYLSTNLGLPYNPSNNWAYSGSTTSNLLSQITNVPASAALHTALFSVVSGGNDIFYSVDIGASNPNAWGVVVTNAVSNLTLAVGTLYTNGAREVVVGNLANFGIPACAFI